MIPGVQNPHWLAPASLNAPVHADRSEESDAPVDRKGDLVRAPGGARGGCQLKEDPQPHVRVALGFEMWKPASLRPSL